MTSPNSLQVALGERSYDIHIAQNALSQAGQYLADFAAGRRVAVVTDRNVGALYQAALADSLQGSGFAPIFITVPAGEASKSWSVLQEVVEQLIAAQIARDDVVIALGGGVVGDLAGFAAAILRRGVRLVQIPTSLLAQVDSSVGGKMGINSAQGKNLIGAFHQPKLVLIDLDVLETLSDREYLAGYAEIVKYGLLGDLPFFEWLEAHGAAAKAGDIAARHEAIYRSCAAKAAIVARDETEQGDRALLNLGHTFGHALEAATGYSDRLLHGEGVAIGMGLAFSLSAQLGLCSQECPSRVYAHLQAMGMKRRLSDISGDLPDASGLVALMAQDKKVKDGRLAFILAHGIGEAFVTNSVDLSVVEAFLAQELLSSIQG